MRALALVLAFAFVSAPALADTSQADLVKSRTDAAAKVYATAMARYKAGTATLDQVATWSANWLRSLREAPLKGAKLKTALADHLARMKDLQTAVNDMVKAGAASTLDADAASYYVAEAELWVARGK